LTLSGKDADRTFPVRRIRRSAVGSRPLPPWCRPPPGPARLVQIAAAPRGATSRQSPPGCASSPPARA